MNTNRRHPLTHWLLLCLVALGPAIWVGSVDADVQSDAKRLDGIFERTSLKIATPDARMHTFNVWLAATDQQLQLGLMHVRQLAPDAGMLFVYPQPFKVSMWMMNTYIPLDMLFVNSKGKVVQVVERIPAQSDKIIAANSDVIGVIELNAGTAERLKIRAGAQVMHAAFSKQR